MTAFNPIRLSLASGLAVAAAFHGIEAAGADSAVVFVYHHIDRDTPAATSVSPERFAEHLDWLESNDFVVAPLPELIDSLRAGDPVPDNTIAITFDDGYRSVLTQAAPLLQRRNWPFTVFVSTDYVDAGYGAYLSWDELRGLVTMGANIGNHTRSHAHLVRREEGETQAQWERRIGEEITGAATRLDEEFGEASFPVLAWPYGEYDTATKQVAERLGFVGVGQHSGAAGPASDWLALPRYPIATGFDALEDFALRARSRPLTIEITGAEEHVTSGGRPPLEAVLRDSDVQRNALACYAGGQGLMELEWLDAETGHFVARPREPLPPGRTKYNCTAPSSTTTGVYHWFSYLWITRRADGGWHEE